jgi:hypothetical protein
VKQKIFFLIALVLAIPTWGLSLVAYFGWRYLALRVGPALRHANLDEVEQAIQLVGTRHGGSLIGTAIQEVNYAHVMSWLGRKSVNCRHLYDPPREAFQVPIAGQWFDVTVQRAPIGEDAIFRVRASEPWLDEIFGWMRTIGLHNGIGKLELPTAQKVHIGAAHAADRMYKTPNRVPANIYRLEHLKSLMLVYRSIEALPKTVGRMRQLEELKLGGNILTELPDEVCELEGLKLLTLWGNNLKRLPQLIGNLRQLDGLDISGNDLRSLPDSIVEIDSLKRLYLNSNEKLILSDRQERWLASLIDGGTEVLMDKGLEDRLVELHPHFSQKISRGGGFNLPAWEPA